MSSNVTIYRITGSNTKPIGLGYDPQYVFEQPVFSAEQRWYDHLLSAEPVEITLPDGYTIARNGYDELRMFDAAGQYVEIVDDHGHPALIIEQWINKQGKPFLRYQRLDK